jgi:antitoxin ParD1/3/4
LTAISARTYILDMETTSLSISLPKPLKEFVEGQVLRGGFSTPSEYVRALVREDRKRQSEEELEGLLLDGLNSGKPVEITPAFWQKKRRGLLRLKQAKGHA